MLAADEWWWWCCSPNAEFSLLLFLIQQRAYGMILATCYIYRSTWGVYACLLATSSTSSDHHRSERLTSKQAFLTILLELLLPFTLQCNHDVADIYAFRILVVIMLDFLHNGCYTKGQRVSSSSSWHTLISWSLPIFNSLQWQHSWWQVKQ